MRIAALFTGVSLRQFDNFLVKNSFGEPTINESIIIHNQEIKYDTMGEWRIWKDLRSMEDRDLYTYKTVTHD